MRNLFFIMLTIVMLNSTSYAETVWKDVTAGIDEEEFNGIALCGDKPNIAYVAASGGVYMTEDAGISWKKSLCLSGRGVGANLVFMDPRDSRVVYSATDKGLYKTENSGREWKRVFSGIGSKKVARYAALDPLDPEIIYIGTEAGFFKSLNSGKDWIGSNGLLSKSAVYHIAASLGEPRFIYAISDKGLFRSGDAGINWERIFPCPSDEEKEDAYDSEAEDIVEEFPDRATSIAVDPADSGRIYLGTEEGIFESCDRGANWRRFTDQGLASKKVNFLLISSVEPAGMYAATDKGVFRFSEDKEEWTELFPGSGMKDVVFIARDSDRENSIWIAAKDGVYKTAEDISKEELVKLEAHKLFAGFENEPSFREVQEAAIRYAEVHPEKIASWRRAAKGRAFLPKLSFGIDESNSNTYEIYTSASNQYYYTGPDDETEGWDINLTWDLGDLIWNDDQTEIDVRSKLMVQLRNDILDEVTRYYFERRRLQIEMLESPAEDTRTQIRKELRLQELTANIDALTGGYFSEHLK